MNRLISQSNLVFQGDEMKETEHNICTKEIQISSAVEMRGEYRNKHKFLDSQSKL